MGNNIGFSKYHTKYLCMIIQFTLNKLASIVLPLHLSAFCDCSRNIFTGMDFPSNGNIYMNMFVKSKCWFYNQKVFTLMRHYY